MDLAFLFHVPHLYNRSISISSYKTTSVHPALKGTT